MSLRWAFRYGNWRPTEEEWIKACACIQSEERSRIAQFCYKRDAKAALCGRLLLRKAVGQLLGIPYKDVCFRRLAAGKPVLTNHGIPASFSVNISHQGSYAVLAAELHREVGVDVMDITRPANTSVQDFFRLMQRNFTPFEWGYIHHGLLGASDKGLDNASRSIEQQQLTRFYRMWCLKESYIKADGKGLQINLQRLNFTPRPLHLNCQAEVLSHGTTLQLDRKLLESWQFQECYLDDTHLAAVCLGPVQGEVATPSSLDSPLPATESRFTPLTFPQLLEGSEEIFPRSSTWWQEFDQRQDAPQKMVDLPA